jgi:hypothetical protein
MNSFHGRTNADDDWVGVTGARSVANPPDQPDRLGPQNQPDRPGPPSLPDPAGLRFRLGNNHVPEIICLGPSLADHPAGADPLEGAERAYRAVAEPLATAYASIAKLGSGTRQGMVTDMWAQAVARGRAVRRQSCCFLYALPGCHECAGCPRLAVSGTR